jgi:AcrR family transcriptional regulator
VRKPKVPRVRRDPLASRQHLLDAAERVFRRSLPDSVGIKEIAKEAGVSHPLVVHYFGTYESLIEAVLERRVQTLREELTLEFLRVFSAEGAGFDLLREHRRIVEKAAQDPITSRLIIWATMSKRFDMRGMPGNFKALKLIADAIEMRGGLSVPREDLEFALIAQAAITILWTVGKQSLREALGRSEADPAVSDEAIRERTRSLLENYLKARRGAPRT